MKRPYRFAVEKTPSGFHINLIGGNNEVVLTGEVRSSAQGCHDTVQEITDGIFFMAGKPLYTAASLKPEGWIDDRPLGGVVDHEGGID